MIFVVLPTHSSRQRLWVALCLLLRVIGRSLYGLADVIEFVGEPSPAQTAFLIFLFLVAHSFLGWQTQIIW